MSGRSYTPSPPRGGYGRRRSPSPRGGYGDRDYPTSLLVRNLRHDCRPEDLRRHFGEFGPLKDVYLPKNYHTGQPRGFGFVQYVDPADAADAKHQMNGQVLLGRELAVVFSDENRQKPADMRARDRYRGRSYYRRSSPHSPRYSHSPPRCSERDHSQSRGHSPSPRRRENSRSISPEGRQLSRERSQSISNRFSRSRVRSRFDGAHVEKNEKESGNERSPTPSAM